MKKEERRMGVPVKVWRKGEKDPKYGVVVEADNQWGFEIYTPDQPYPNPDRFVWDEANDFWVEVLPEDIPEEHVEGVEEVLAREIYGIFFRFPHRR